METSACIPTSTPPLGRRRRGGRRADKVEVSAIMLCYATIDQVTPEFFQESYIAVRRLGGVTDRGRGRRAHGSCVGVNPNLQIS